MGRPTSLLVGLGALAFACAPPEPEVMYMFQREAPTSAEVKACLAIDGASRRVAEELSEHDPDHFCAGSKLDQCAAKCGEGDLVSCNNYATVHIRSGNHGCAATLLDFACSEGMSFACGNLAWMYYQGKGVERDRKRALELGRESCKRSGGQGCRVAALLSTNPADSVHLLEQACTLGDETGCALWAERLKIGDGVEADPERGARILEETCDRLGAVACQQIGFDLLDEGGANAARRAIPYLQKACQAETDSCSALAAVLLQLPFNERDYSLIIELARTSCEDASGGGCTLVGSLTQTGRIKPHDPASMRQTWAKGCELDNAWACHHLALYDWSAYNIDVNRSAATSRVAQLCTFEASESACSLLARYHAIHAAPPVWQGSLAQLNERCNRGRRSECFERIRLSMIREGMSDLSTPTPKTAEEHHLLAAKALTARQLDAAKDRLAKAVRSAPNPDVAAIPASWLRVLGPANKTDTEEVDRALREATSNATGWTRSLAQYSLGEIDESSLLKGAATGPDVVTNNSKLAEASFLLGLKEHVAGDTEQAKSYFKKTIATGAIDSIELATATALLRQM